jgi:hypothetical protein
MTRLVALLVSAEGRVALRAYAPFHLSFDALRCVPWAFFSRDSFEHRCCCCGSAHTLCGHVCLPPQRLVVHFGTTSRSRDTVGSAMLILLKVVVVCAGRGHAPAAAGMKLFVTSVKWTRCEPSSAGAPERMPCSLVGHHASSVLAGHPTLVVRKSDYQPRTLAHLNAVLPGVV